MPTHWLRLGESETTLAEVEAETLGETLAEGDDEMPTHWLRLGEVRGRDTGRNANRGRCRCRHTG